ncbi:hypothetical protein NE237_023591 [Protea cynaroides]|uniref:Uncharacterized protein n=1 Tax=Protea cynaroides TaxID=273540 RepID=A0A9Q0HC07_9MAGN|nr:hypothetical protein NE237_023591 [Protea cynaroides]
MGGRVEESPYGQVPSGAYAKVYQRRRNAVAVPDQVPVVTPVSAPSSSQPSSDDLLIALRKGFAVDMPAHDVALEIAYQINMGAKGGDWEEHFVTITFLHTYQDLPRMPIHTKTFAGNAL